MLPGVNTIQPSISDLIIVVLITESYMQGFRVEYELVITQFMLTMFKQSAKNIIEYSTTHTHPTALAVVSPLCTIMSALLSAQLALTNCTTNCAIDCTQKALLHDQSLSYFELLITGDFTISITHCSFSASPGWSPSLSNQYRC